MVRLEEIEAERPLELEHFTLILRIIYILAQLEGDVVKRTPLKLSKHKQENGIWSEPGVLRTVEPNPIMSWELFL